MFFNTKIPFINPGLKKIEAEKGGVHLLDVSESKTQLIQINDVNSIAS